VVANVLTHGVIQNIKLEIVFLSMFPKKMLMMEKVVQMFLLVLNTQEDVGQQPKHMMIRPNNMVTYVKEFNNSSRGSSDPLFLSKYK